MRKKIEKAKKLLENGGYTCVLSDGETVWTHSERGVVPLLSYVREGRRLPAFCAADKVVGRAAAFLYVQMEIGGLYAEVLSEPAKEILDRYGIPTEYGILTEAIRNRAGDGFCPMETATREIQDPIEAICAIEAKLKALREGK